MSNTSKANRILNEEGLISLTHKGSKFVYRRIKDQTYKIGSGRLCPICGFSGRKFTPFGNPPRPEARCPKCTAKERHRLMWIYIKNRTSWLEGNRDILYFAPFERMEKNLREEGNVITADLMKTDVDVRTDITRLPFKDSTFDAIICSHVLEHVPDDSTAMSEMYRVLDSGGEILIMVPKDQDRERTYEGGTIVSPEVRLKVFGQENHVRWYGKDIVKRLSENGFDVSIERYADEFSDREITRYGLKVYDQYLGRIKHEDIHLCKNREE